MPQSWPCCGLLHVMLLRRMGRRSWKPWFLGLGIELGSLQLLRLAARFCRAADQQVVADPAMQQSPLPLLYSLQAFRWMALEKQGLQRRKALLLWYLIRSPFFEPRGVLLAVCSLGCVQFRWC
ncbi:hypothetical protein WJX74_000719 [Apatococcus lobatus]|uniref:Peroxisomal membrane protein PEX16 n=1 Tax=Apatococcus lobatus TaxID=904363 RepID=A0AAW1S9B9_9CHLO